MKRISMLAVVTMAVWVTLGGSAAFAATPLEERVEKLEKKVEALEATLSGVARHGGTLEFSGMNVQIDNGTESEKLSTVSAT
jgi:hypothetical protein